MFDKEIQQRTNEKFIVEIEKAAIETSNLLREITVEDGPKL